MVVDEPGLSGGVIDRLAEQGVPVVAYNGGRRAGLVPNPERFKNRRAAAYWMLRRRYSCQSCSHHRHRFRIA